MSKYLKARETLREVNLPDEITQQLMKEIDLAEDMPGDLSLELAMKMYKATMKYYVAKYSAE